MGDQGLTSACPLSIILDVMSTVLPRFTCGSPNVPAYGDRVFTEKWLKLGDSTNPARLVSWGCTQQMHLLVRKSLRGPGRQLSAGGKGCCAPKTALLNAWSWASSENKILLSNSSSLWHFVTGVCADWFGGYSLVFNCLSLIRYCVGT